MTSPVSDGAPGSSAAKEGRSKFRRVAVLLVFGLVLVGGALLFRHYWYARPIGHGPAGPAVLREPFARVWTERKVHFVGLGDSVTAGYGATPGHSYFQLLGRNSKDDVAAMQGVCLAAVLPNLKSTNLALSASTSIDHLETLLPRLEVQDAEIFGIVVLTTGGNDIIHNYGQTPPREGAMYGASFEQAEPWIRNFETRLDAIISRIGEKFPAGCQIFLANIYDPTDGVGDAQMAGLPAWADGIKVIDAYNAVIARCAERHANVHLVNMHDAFLGHGIHCLLFWREHYHRDDPGYWYFDNLEDPNDRGNDALRRLFLIEMARVLQGLLMENNQKKTVVE